MYVTNWLVVAVGGILSFWVGFWSKLGILRLANE